MKGYGEKMEKDWLQGISEEVRVQKLVETNEFTGRYGLTLSEQDIWQKEMPFHDIHTLESMREQ